MARLPAACAAALLLSAAGILARLSYRGLSATVHVFDAATPDWYSVTALSL